MPDPAGTLYRDLSGNGKGVMDLADVAPVYPLTDLVGAFTADNRAAIQNKINQVYANDGGTVILNRGEYRIDDVLDTTQPNAAIVVRENVTLDLNGSVVYVYMKRLNSSAFRLQSHAHITNGTIVVVSQPQGGTISAQSAVHACVSVGPILGDTLANIAMFDYAHDWSITKLSVSSDKWTGTIGAAAITVVGGCYDGIIEDIEVPDSARLYAAVTVDWGIYGSIQSQPATPPVPPRDTILNNMNVNKTNYIAGTAGTTHPHGLRIKNITIGKLTAPYTGQDTGSLGVRLSGVYDVTVSCVNAKELTSSLFIHTVGDLGAEFGTATERLMLGRNVVFEHSTCDQCHSQPLLYSDTRADNVADAVAAGYTAFTDPQYVTNMLFDEITGCGDGTGYGLRIIDQKGGVIRNPILENFLTGIDIDQRTYNIRVETPTVRNSQEDGILVHHGTYPPQNINIIDPIVVGSGQNAGFADVAGVHIGTSENCRLLFGKYGKHEGEATQKFGFRIASGAVRAVVVYPDIVNYKVGGDRWWIQRSDCTIVHDAYNSGPAIPRAIAQNAVKVNHTGDTAVFQFASITVPGGAMGPNGQLQVVMAVGATGASAKNVTVKANGTTIGTLIISSGDLSGEQTFRISNRNDAGQQMTAMYGTAWPFAQAPVLTSIDTNNDWTITLHGQNTNAAHNISLESYLVTIWPKE